MTTIPVLEVCDLTVRTPAGRIIVDAVDLQLYDGEVLAVVGESGSGKTTTALALLGYFRDGAQLVRGEVRVGDVEVLAVPEKQRRRLRGRSIAYVPQDPTTSLNPAHRIGRLLGEALGFVGDDTTERRLELLELVHLPSTPALLKRYPFELSGGQQQRLAIAIALAARPQVVVLDEPTTGLDVTTQQHIVDLVRELADTGQAAFVYISHDLAVVSAVADRVAVMHTGRVVDTGGTASVLRTPEHPYSRLLVATAPDARGVSVVLDEDGHRPRGDDFDSDRWTRLSVVPVPPSPEPGPGADDVLRVEGLVVTYGRGHGARTVLRGADLTVKAGECVGLVGESGSGKSTLGRAVAGLVAPTSGRILLDGTSLGPHARRRSLEQLRALQLIYQNPDRSLNPRESVAEAIARTLLSFERGLSAAGRAARVREVADRVELPLGLLRRMPRELSGGEKQRVAVGRALVARPRVLICDEVTSALDVSTQAAIIQLLRDLTADGLSLLYITHDLGAVRSLAHRIAVLNAGEICESGPTEDVLDRPSHTYTRELIACTPLLQP